MNVKLKKSDRIIVCAYALLGVVATAALALMLAGGVEIRLLGKVYVLAPGLWPMILMALITAVLLIWSVRVMMVAFYHAPKVDKSSVSVQNTENGAVRISMQAMDTLVKQAIGQADGVEEIKTAIVNHEDSISVNIEMTLDSDVHIPNVTMLMQRAIKNFIEEYSGIAVRDVSVMVGKIVEVPQGALAQSAVPAIERQPAFEKGADADVPYAQDEPESEPASEPASQPEGEMESEEAPRWNAVALDEEAEAGEQEKGEVLPEDAARDDAQDAPEAQTEQENPGEKNAW
ncbi:MAG: alkaline shock response membrane anchor protein AmaP [Clostridia bacterium]